MPLSCPRKQVANNYYLVQELPETLFIWTLDYPLALMWVKALFSKWGSAHLTLKNDSSFFVLLQNAYLAVAAHFKLVYLICPIPTKPLLGKAHFKVDPENFMNIPISTSLFQDPTKNLSRWWCHILHWWYYY